MAMSRDQGKWGKGTSGNPGGRVVFKQLSDALRSELLANPNHARRIARKLITQAEDGNLQAIALLLDRLEGKAVQQVDLADTTQVGASERLARIMELQARVIDDADMVPAIEQGERRG